MRATAIQGLARRLLTHEAGGIAGREALRGATERVSEKLRAHLSQRIGQEGFRTLLARAQALAAAQFPHLGAQGGETELDAAGGAVALVAHLLALLVTFIGEDLTLRMLGAVWPDLDWSEVGGGERP